MKTSPVPCSSLCCALASGGCGTAAVASADTIPSCATVAGFFFFFFFFGFFTFSLSSPCSWFAPSPSSGGGEVIVPLPRSAFSRRCARSLARQTSHMRHGFVGERRLKHALMMQTWFVRRIPRAAGGKPVPGVPSWSYERPCSSSGSGPLSGPGVASDLCPPTETTQ